MLWFFHTSGQIREHKTRYGIHEKDKDFKK